MSRSRQRYQYHWGGFSSDKLSKRWAHKRERRVIRARLGVGDDQDTLKLTRELSDPWNYAKDGGWGLDPRDQATAKRLRK